MESRRVRRRHGFMMKEAITLCCGFIFLFSLFAVLSSSSYRRSVRLGGGGREAEEARRRTGVVPATVYGQVRRLHPVQPGARGCAARHSGDHRVLPRGVAVQMRQQTLHALTPSSPWSPDQPKELRGTLYLPPIVFVTVVYWGGSTQD
ncbi:unnamed protein product [Musa acuminata subsp. malaccensis]|uniref:(wild Malaysian banana) hypothetical protein n=1 Tax=Musa acuminata subsp. malaccensis TaxID=214687 RepID=A0A804IRD7_MUSAM|nr:PREDICTED: uncharacterized protein LOC103982017 isoform X1 [Musa acuminata subsp. malaccensis]CAG1842719.1 unnamed protein product [Musa acuminata subsp. malaccensis]